jgi:DNA-binding NtrC family response regulator
VRQQDDLTVSTWVTRADGRLPQLCRRSCQVRIVSGPERGKHVSFSDRLRIGAQRSCDLVLDDPTVSGVHCEIHLDPLGYSLRDLGSTNGTFVGDLRVSQAYLNPGSTFRVGQTELRLHATREQVDVPLAETDSYGALAGRSLAMRELYVQIERLAASDARVVISGETGTGKELVAQTLVEEGPRRGGPFVIFDCGAVSFTLLESELFGHVRGAFTGAHTSRPGVFEQAHRGTLLLDEIGELPLELQPKLLRVLEERKVRRIGDDRARPIDVRVLAATNRELDVEVSRGAFRKDLYYRLAVAELRLPPLRQRLDDIPLLAERFRAQLPSRRVAPLEPEILKQLAAHHWPGNVRELRNVIERLALLPDAEPFVTAPPGPEPAVDLDKPFKQAKAALVDQFEKRYFAAMLERHNGNIAGAARQAGVDRVTLHRLVNRHRLTVERG